MWVVRGYDSLFIINGNAIQEIRLSCYATISLEKENCHLFKMEANGIRNSELPRHEKFWIQSCFIFHWKFYFSGRQFAYAVDIRGHCLWRFFIKKFLYFMLNAYREIVKIHVEWLGKQTQENMTKYSMWASRMKKKQIRNLFSSRRRYQSFCDDFNYSLECIGPKIYDDQAEHDELTFHVSVEMIDFSFFLFFLMDAKQFFFSFLFFPVCYSNGFWLPTHTLAHSVTASQHTHVNIIQCATER